jgi:hypothetical protein
MQWNSSSIFSSRRGINDSSERREARAESGAIGKLSLPNHFIEQIQNSNQIITLQDIN